MARNQKHKSQQGKSKKRQKQEDQKKELKVNVEGTVLEVLPNGEYLIEIQIGGIKHTITGYLSGKVRRFYIKINQNDTVVVEMSPEYNLDKGRIVWKKGGRRSLPDFLEVADTEAT